MEEKGDQPRGYADAYILTDEEAANVKATPPDLASLGCSFYGKSREQVPKLFAGRGVKDPSSSAIITAVSIGNECVAACAGGAR